MSKVDHLTAEKKEKKEREKNNIIPKDDYSPRAMMLCSPLYFLGFYFLILFHMCIPQHYLAHALHNVIQLLQWYTNSRQGYIHFPKKPNIEGSYLFVSWWNMKIF